MMFKKRQARNIRKKKSDDEDENNGDARSDNESRGSNGSASTRDQKKSDNIGGTKSVPSTNNLLSFGDEDEEEVFQIRKSAASRNLERSRQKMRTTQKSVKIETISSTKKKETRSSPLDSDDDEIIIKEVKKFEIKSEQKEPTTILIGGDAEEFEEEEKEPIMGKFKDVLTSGAIPDANLIHMARKQRQMAREMGTGDAPLTYVPLKKMDDTQKYKKDKSRLVREDDDNENSDSGEEGGRFYSKLHDEDEEQRRQVEADFLRVEQGDSDEDDKDDELDRWEKEQIRKGVSRNQLGYFGQDYLAANYGIDSKGRFSNFGDKERATESPSIKDIKIPQPMEIDMDLVNDDDEGTPVQKVPENQRSTLPKIGGGLQPSETLMTFQDVKAKLELRKTEQQSLYNAHLLERSKVRDFLSENESSTAKLEDSVPKLNEQYRFYQEMRTYVRDLLDCFSEKMPLIEKCTTRIMELWTVRASFLTKRRQQDVKDQYEECSASASGKMQLLQQNSDRMMRAAEREARRTRRRQGREKTLASLGHHEGMSSDDEEAPSRIVNFNSEKVTISAEALDIFKDTVDEFCSIEEITRRFMDWRKAYKDAFDQAFIIYCLPKLLSPLIQARLMVWNPLEANSPSLSSMDWYSPLADMERTQREHFNEDDEFELVFSVVDSAVLPRIKDIANSIWDPTSSSQTSAFVAFLSNLRRDHPKASENGKQFKALKDAIQNRIKQSLDDDMFTPIYSKEAVENKSTGAAAFLDRQFWFSIKIIQNICGWAALFSDTEIQELIFDGVINRHVILGLQCGGSMDMTTLTKVKAVCSALPSSWFAGTKDGESSPQLEPLCKMLVRIADDFNGNKTMDKGAVKDATKEIYRLLLKLRGWKHAETLSQKYRVK